VIEEGGGIDCTEAGEDYSVSGAEYLGEQPDFGYVSSESVAPLEAAASPAVSRTKAVVTHRRHKKSHKAKKAGAVTCKLSTQVQLSYAIAYPAA
jgi:hypothetical protein